MPKVRHISRLYEIATQVLIRQMIIMQINGFSKSKSNNAILPKSDSGICISNGKSKAMCERVIQFVQVQHSPKNVSSVEMNNNHKQRAIYLYLFCNSVFYNVRTPEWWHENVSKSYQPRRNVECMCT